MSSSSSSASRNHPPNPPQRGGSSSRWGDRRRRRRDETQQSAGVSDDEAMRALLASATEREQCRVAATSTGGRNNNNNNDHHRKRGRPGGDEDNHRWGAPGQQQQRLADNDSYYGPRGEEGVGGGREEDPRRQQQQRRYNDDDRRGPAKVIVERDEGFLELLQTGAPVEQVKKPPAHKPNFGLSGALAKDTGGGGRVYKGVLLKFQEPPEARVPVTQWRFYVFKGKEMLETLHISKQSAYLCGRNTDICDIQMAHTSLSGQHAVLQYRALPNKETGRLLCQPYIMDLESTNGTFLNGVKLDGARYYQLKKGDVLTFGASKREYVLLTDNTTAIR